MLQKDRGLLEREGGHQYPLCTSPSVDVCPYNSLFLFGPPSVQPHLSFSFTHNYLSSPSIIRTSAQLRRSKSLKYRLRLIHSILSSSLKYLSPSFHTASQEVGVATNKSDQGPLGLMKKKKKKKRADVLPPSPSLTFIKPNPSLPSSLRLVCAAYRHSPACCLWGSGTNMRSKLLKGMLIHMYKRPQCEERLHPHTSTAHAWDTYIHIRMCVHIQYVCSICAIHIHLLDYF